MPGSPPCHTAQEVCATTSHHHHQQQQQQPPDEATMAAWAERQQELAQKVHVPVSELYQISPTSTFYQREEEEEDHDKDRGSARFLGAVDMRFEHDSFLLPIEQLQAIVGGLRGEGGASGTTIPALKEVAAAVAAQLESDMSAQERWSSGTYHEQGTRDALPPLTRIAGLDISFIPDTSLGVACLAVFSYPELQPIRTFMHHCELTEPYVSGFLAFREVQPALALFAKYDKVLTEEQCRPQLLFVDGCGVHHPRRCGLAAHLGVLLQIPTIGCAKKMLIVDGVDRDDVASCFPTHTEQQEGSHCGGGPSTVRAGKQQCRQLSGEPLWLPPLHPILGRSTNPSLPYPHRSMYGYALLTTGNSAKKSIFVSPGHKVGFAMAAALVVSACHSRIPEPIRGADLSSRQYIREGKHLETN